MIKKKIDKKDNIVNFPSKLTSLEKENISTSVILKMIRKDRWRIYDLVFQSFSLVDYFKYSYDEKIKRAESMEDLLQEMLQRTST